MNKRLAIITQTYGADINECRLLAKSIDKFVPKSIEHHIFINDDDFKLFSSDSYFKNKLLHKKSEILPKYLFRFPYKLLGHKYHISPITIPVREWIVQQICKIGVFDVLPNNVDATINIDSESIFIKPFEYSHFIKNDKYLLFQENFKEEPNHLDYCSIGKKLLGIDQPIAELSKFCYQSACVIFEKNNITDLKHYIERNSLIPNWKYKLCNTYRFSEYYLYGLCCNYILSNRNHFISNIRPFPMLDISKLNYNQFCQNIEKCILDENIQGVWLQKHQRNNHNVSNINFNLITDFIENKILNI